MLFVGAAANTITVDDDCTDDYYYPSNITGVTLTHAITDPGSTLLIATAVCCFLSIAILPCLLRWGEQFDQHSKRRKTKKLRRPKKGNIAEYISEPEIPEIPPEINDDTNKTPEESDGLAQSTRKTSKNKYGKSKSGVSSLGSIGEEDLAPPFRTKKFKNSKRSLGSIGEEHLAPSPSSIGADWLHSRKHRSSVEIDQPFDEFSVSVGSSESSHTAKSLASFAETVISCQPRSKRRVAKTPTDRLQTLKKNLEREGRIGVGDEAPLLALKRSVSGPETKYFSGHSFKKKGSSSLGSGIALPEERSVNGSEANSQTDHSAHVKEWQDLPLFKRKSASSIASRKLSINHLEAVPELSSEFPSDPLTNTSEKRDLRICCGPIAFWRPSVIKQAFDDAVDMFENDVETKRILNIALPFTLSEFILSICEVVHLAFISRYLGTPAVAALTAVDIFLGTTSEFLGGIIDSQLSITSHALGVGNNYLAGQYVQQAQILFTLFYIPTYVFWWHYVYPATLWLGMSEKVAIMAQSYARVQMINDWMDCMSCSIHSMYEVSDHVWFSSISDVIFEGLGLAAVIPALIYIEGVNLVTLAYIDMGLESLGIIFAIFYPLHKGWLKIFIPGWLCNFSLTNTTGVWNLMRTALPLSFGELVAYGEWELLTIFAAHNGQSQIATWGLLGALWETFESFTEGIGDAAEIRVAYHLGRGNPKSAQISGIKGAIIGTVAAFTVTSLFWIVGEEIPGWFSRDPEVKHMMMQAIPLMGLGNVSMVFGMVCWAIVGAQGRYNVATVMSFVSSWLVTLPLAALFIYVYEYGIQGLVAAVAIGYSCLSMMLIYVMARSDWPKLSKIIQERNAFVGETLSLDSDSESGASSDSSSFNPSNSTSSAATSFHRPGDSSSAAPSFHRPDEVSSAPSSFHRLDDATSASNPSTISGSTYFRPDWVKASSTHSPSQAPSVEAPSDEVPSVEAPLDEALSGNQCWI